MNTKKLIALIISAAFILSSLCACAPKETGGASSHIHTENEHNHNADGTENTTSKKPTNGDKNTSSKTSITITRPIASGKDKNVNLNKYTELNAEGKNVSTKLFEDFDNKETEVLHFYTVKGTAHASTSYISYDLIDKKVKCYKEDRNEQEIRDFKILLSLSTWTPKKFTAKTTPSTVIYFDDDFHLNIEEKVDGAYWLSLNASYGKVYYIVPEAVYNYVVEFSR